MAMRRVYSQGMNLGRHTEVGYDEVKEKSYKLVDKGNRLHELGEKFAADKRKLEDAIERVQAAKIKAEDKFAMITELNAAIDKVQVQYEHDVADEETKIQQEIEEQLEEMNQSVVELSEQSDSLKNVTMDIATTDTTAAVEATESKKQAFEQLHKEYTDKLRLQMEQAEMLQRSIRNRRLSGR